MHCPTSRLTLAGLLLSGLLAGCGDAPNPILSAEDPPAPASGTAAHATVAEGDEDVQRLHQPFAKVIRSEPPEGWHRPPDVTMANRPTGPIYTDVLRNWDNIVFRTPERRAVEYRALVETEDGQIEIALRPDLAPNHVRNFIALARAGYFDGLVFQRTLREKVDGHPDIELIEGGCPLGTGEAGHGSIGYWLNPEFTTEPQGEGTVGACHAGEPDTAACKFYILLGKAPALDAQYTVFGKVVTGLDAARRIHARPVRKDAEYPEQDRPVKPVVIRKVTIQSREVEGLASHGYSSR